MSKEVNEFFMGNSSPALSFLEPGTSHKGRITHMEMRQMIGLQDSKPQFWDDGSPKMQAVITLQTDYRDDPEDNGQRRLFVGSKGMKIAVTAAVKKAGVDGLAVGGKLAVKYTRNGEATQRGFNPPKVYAAQYEAPAPELEVEDVPHDLADYSDEPF
jgi:hypothetical protein